MRHIVALRGDPPEPGSALRSRIRTAIANAAELVAGLKAVAPFDISVAAYPEIHPDSAIAQSDLDNLKRKVDAGADRAITQFFFSAGMLLPLPRRSRGGRHRRRDRARHPARLQRRARPAASPQTCGASIPDWLDELFEGLDDLPAARQLIAATVAAELCGQLYAGGVRHFHFYTLNRAELSYAICHLLGVRAKSMTLPPQTPSRRSRQAHPDQGRRLRHR